MAGRQQSSVLVLVVAMAMMLPGWRARGQDRASSPQTVVDVLRGMSDGAAVIFVGQVLAVRRVGAEAGIVEVEFRVDQAVRGCSAGVPYRMREWGGLWASGSERYRVGQRLLMLLHAPSRGGLSSPVGGLDGAIPVRSGSAGPEFVDLRWLGVRVPRAVSYREEARVVGGGMSKMEIAESGARVGVAPITLLQGGVAEGASVQSASVPGASVSGASVPEQQASVRTVLAMLMTWERAQHVAP